MSEALDLFVKSVRVEEKKEEKDEELERLIRQMEQMTQNVTRQREESERLAERANSLYINYQPATDLLARLKELSSMGDWEAIRSAMLGMPGVVAVDPKNHNATVKLGEFEVKVDYTVGLEENANLLFLEAKEAKSKLVGAEQAAKETELKIASRRKKGEAIARTAVKDVKPTKRFWFEAYKWFITSGGKLVLAGRDARGERPGGKETSDLEGPVRPRRCPRGTVHDPEGRRGGHRGGAARTLPVRAGAFQGLERRGERRDRLLGGA